MAELEAGAEIPGTNGCTFVEELAAEPWGKIERAKHPGHGDVLLVRYTTGEGRQLFEEAREGLEKWKSIRENNLCLQFLAIHEINGDIDTPYLVIEDGGGRPMADPSIMGGDIPQAPVVFWEWANRAIVEAHDCDFSHIGLSGLTLFVTGQEDPAYRILPIAPGARKKAALVNGGRYIPEEIESALPLDELNPDSYAAALMTAQWLTGQADPPTHGEAFREAIPYQRLRVAITNGLVPSGGKYGDPKLTEIALRRWFRMEMAEDLKEIREAKEASERTPFQQKLHDNRKLITQGGIGLGVVVLLLILVMALPRMFTTRDTINTPYGLVNLFHAALIEKNAAGAKGYTSGEATPQTDRLLDLINEMQERNLASPFNRAVPQVAGAGGMRTVKTDLRGSAGDTFIQTEMNIQENPDGTWTIVGLFFTPMRELE